MGIDRGTKPAKNSLPAIVSRIKIMGNLDISEKRLPQDGRTRLVIDGREIDFRISSLPSIHGEKMVLRILDRAHALMSLQDLGFSAANMDKITSLIRRPYGMIVVTDYRIRQNYYPVQHTH